jgi:hypothetical protein
VASDVQNNNHVGTQQASNSRQEQSLVLNGNNIPPTFQFTQNHNPLIQSLNGQSLPTTYFPTFTSPIPLSSNGPIPSLTPADHQFNSFPNNNSPIIITQPLTETNETQSFTHQLLTFTSQANTKDPHVSQIEPTRQPRVPHKPVSVTRTNPTHITEPTRNQPRPEKKPKTTIPKNPNQPIACLVPEPEKMDDVDLQSEKKRRREEDNSNISDTSKTHEHFLTAGPGSQACRDQ